MSSERPALILVVEDDADSANLVAEALRSEGLDVRVARTTAGARRSAADEPPEVAIVDLVLPDGDGLDLAINLLHLYPALRIVFATGFHREGSRAARQLGARFLPKPFRVEELCSIVRAAVAVEDDHDMVGSDQPWRREASMARVGERLKTGQTCNTSGNYVFDGYLDGTSTPAPDENERVIPLSGGETFPPAKSSGKGAWWKLQRIT